MKTILMFTLICFAFSIWGPAKEAARPGIACGEEQDEVESLSDCVDKSLLVGKKYYDRCCFIRGQFYGIKLQGCEPLTEEEYLDIVETKKKKEKEATDAFRANMSEYETSTEGYYTKIYQIDCSSSVIKFFSFATIFLALLF